MIHYGRITRVLITKDYTHEKIPIDTATVKSATASLLAGWDDIFPEKSYDEHEITITQDVTTTRWLDLRTAIIQEDDNEKYPYNITQWRELYDMDVQIENDSDGQLRATVTIYNPPEQWKGKTFAQYGFNNEDVSWKPIKSDQDAYQTIVIYSGYRNDLPRIFYGTIDNITFTHEENESKFEIKAISDTTPKNSKFKDVTLPIGIDLSEAITIVCNTADITVGRLVTEFDDGTEIKLENQYSFSNNTKAKDAINKILKKENLKASLPKDNRRIDPGLKATFDNGFVSVIPETWHIKTGYKFDYSNGLIQFKERESQQDSGKEYELKTTFLPNISTHNAVLAHTGYKSDGTKKYSAFNVKAYNHDIPVDSSATTTLVCSHLDLEDKE